MHYSHICSDTCINKPTHVSCIEVWYIQYIHYIVLIIIINGYVTGLCMYWTTLFVIILECTSTYKKKQKQNCKTASGRFFRRYSRRSHYFHGTWQLHVFYCPWIPSSGTRCLPVVILIILTLYRPSLMWVFVSSLLTKSLKNKKYLKLIVGKSL